MTFDPITDGTMRAAVQYQKLNWWSHDHFTPSHQILEKLAMKLINCTAKYTNMTFDPINDGTMRAASPKTMCVFNYP